MGDAGPGLSGLAETTISFTGPIGDEIRNRAFPATKMRVLTMPVPDAVTVRASESG